MRYCARCLYPANHPLGLTFDAAGVCSGCRVHEEKDELDWAERGERLRDLLAAHRGAGAPYDCILPVSGARDSWFLVHTVKVVHGLRPLLVTYNKEFNTRLGVRNLNRLRSAFDCDHVQANVSPDLARRVARAALDKVGSVYWHNLAGTTAFPVQMAVTMGVPLVIWPVHQGLDQVGMFRHGDEVEMGRRHRKDHDLLGLEAADLAAGTDLDPEELAPFQYPADRDIARLGLRGIYLNNFIRWDSKAQHEEMIRRYGYESLPQERTFNTYEDADCLHYSGTHDWVKFLKWGFGKATDHACREIRLKRMTRETGAALAKEYAFREPADLPLFLDWIGMRRGELQERIDRWRDLAIWERGPGGWTLRDAIWNHQDDPGVEAARLDSDDTWRHLTTPRLADNEPEWRHTIVDRGWVD